MNQQASRSSRPSAAVRAWGEPMGYQPWGFTDLQMCSDVQSQLVKPASPQLLSKAQTEKQAQVDGTGRTVLLAE